MLLWWKSRSPRRLSQRPRRNHSALVYLVLSYRSTWYHAFLHHLFTVKKHTNPVRHISTSVFEYFLVHHEPSGLFCNMWNGWRELTTKLPHLECLRFVILFFTQLLSWFALWVVGRVVWKVIIEWRAFTPWCLLIGWPQFACLYFSKICSIVYIIL